MTTQAIIESGMTFGPYPIGQCFYIEKSACYKKVQEGVQMAEFLLLKQQEKGPAVWVVEAKTSSPKAETQPNFAQFIDEIRTKLTNGFLLAVAARLQSALVQALKPVVKTWALPATSVAVLNHELAQEHSLILSAAAAAP